MITPISPMDVRILYKERETELELAIERRLARESRGEMESAKRVDPWYAQAAYWLKERSPFHAFQKQVAAKPARMEKSCPC